MRKKFNLPAFLFIFILFVGCNKNEKETGCINEERLTMLIDSVLSAINEPEVPGNIIDITEYTGLLPDAEGTYDFRNAINKALAELEKQGGGSLLFPHPLGKSAWIKTTAVYRIKGYIEMKSNTRLLLGKNTRLFFEFHPENYLHDGKGVLTRYEGSTIFGYAPLIRGFNINNIVIEADKGNGAMPVIDGDGEKWIQWMLIGENRRRERGLLPSHQFVRGINHQDVPVKERQFGDAGNYFLRPSTMEFFLCRDVRVENVKIENAPFWCVHPVFSENLVFRNMFFDAQNVNNDGFDPESSRNILIENIVFDNHDDNVAVKAGRDREGREGADINGTILENISSPYINAGRIGGPTENVLVRECVFKGHNAICIGSEMSGGASNIIAVNNIAPQNVVIGLFLKSSRKRGGYIHDVYVKNLKIKYASASAVSFIPNYDGDTTSQHPPTFRNVYVEDVEVEKAGQGIRIYGWPDKKITDVCMKNVSITEVEDTSEIFVINHAENIRMYDISVEGKSFDGQYSISNKEIKTPRQF